MPMEYRDCAWDRFDGDVAAYGSNYRARDFAERKRLSRCNIENAGRSLLQRELDNASQIADVHVIALLLAFTEQRNLALRNRGAEESVGAVRVVGIAWSENRP